MKRQQTYFKGYLLCFFGVSSSPLVLNKCACACKRCGKLKRLKLLPPTVCAAPETPHQ